MPASLLCQSALTPPGEERLHDALPVAFVGILALGSSALAAADNTVTIVSWGGHHAGPRTHQRLAADCNRARHHIKENTIGANSDIKARVQAGDNTWDIVDISSKAAVDFARQGLLEPLDYHAIDTKGTDPALAQPDWVDRKPCRRRSVGASGRPASR